MNIPIPFGTRTYKSRSIPVSDQNIINFWLEVMDSDAKGKFILHGRAGLKLFGTAGNGPHRGSHEFQGNDYRVSGNNLYRGTSGGTYTDLGTIGGSDKVSMTDNGSELKISSKSDGYIWDGRLTTITDPDYKKGHFSAYLDGYFISEIPATGDWQISNLLTGKIYDSTDDGTTLSHPDNVVRVIAVNDIVYPIGTDSIEGFFNSATNDFPFDKIREATIGKGCKAPNSIAILNDDRFYFLANDNRVWGVSGAELIEVSDPTFSYQLSLLTNYDDAEAFIFEDSGHQFYQISFPTDNITYVLDITTRLWGQASYFNNGNHERHRACCYSWSYDKHLVGDYANGNVYEMSSSTYDDNGDVIVGEIVSPPLHNGGERISIPSLYFDMEAGVGVTTGQGSSPHIQLEVSLNGGRSYNISRSEPIGKLGEYGHRTIFNRVGSSPTSIVLKATISAPIKRAITGVYRAA